MQICRPLYLSLDNTYSPLETDRGPGLEEFVVPCTIEAATDRDYLHVAALDRISWPIAPDLFIPDGEHIWRIWCDMATLLVARRPAGSEPLSESGDIAGALVMFPTNTEELCLHKIMVHSDCRGMGIGSELMKAGLAQAVAPVLLTVDPTNSAAVTLYENFGFTVRQRIDGYYRPHEDRLIMVHPGPS
ncbi:MAG: N-acetyltransferase [Planctomycetota bacterium]|nr:N-acetyltransferase [Planctomycetota bacterium]MED5447584.1 N-acetyltransferase [Planctomycetota bacterium]